MRNEPLAVVEGPAIEHRTMRRHRVGGESREVEGCGRCRGAGVSGWGCGSGSGENVGGCWCLG